jgi:dGTPase
MEVAAIARNISRALRLNEDLTETIALAHDLGHSPFGHKGEKVLDRLMRQHGGFEHNRQSLRVVEEIEQKYSHHPGLNLTWETREGLLKHFQPGKHPSRRKSFPAKCSSLEAQVANLADEITYYSHDLDDGLTSGLLSETQLNREVDLWTRAARKVQRQNGKLAAETRIYLILRSITDEQVTDVVNTTMQAIRSAGVGHADEVRLLPRHLVQYSAARRKLNVELRTFLYKNLYYNPVVQEPNLRAVQMLEDLFKFYLANPSEIGERSRRRARKIGRHAAVCDYLAGMTDRYAISEHQRVFGLSS